MISVNLHMTNQREGERKKKTNAYKYLAVNFYDYKIQINVNPRIVTQKTVFL